MRFVQLPPSSHMMNFHKFSAHVVPTNDPQIQKAIQWLKANQRESGRWWTRSLNTDKHHLITYSGTAYPLLALMKCNELPKAARVVAKQK